MADNASLIHPASDEADAARIAAELTAPTRARAGEGWHVVVQVVAGGSTGYARLLDSASPGNGSQRWLKHARRGASPGGWTEAHHPRSQAALGAWREQHARDVDRLLIDRCNAAWRCDATAPYVVEFPAAALASSAPA